MTLCLVVAVTIKVDQIIVADNAMGMDEVGVKRAMTLADSEKKGKLGEFGLGLKTACLSLGEIFTVKTKRLGCPMEYSVSFDEIEWRAATNGWTLQLHESESAQNEHYTIVTIEKLKKFYPNLHGYIRNDLQKRFAPFISDGKVKITVNGKICHPDEPELVEGSKKEFRLSLPAGNTVYGWYGLLRQGSNKGLYGFTTFRRGRMITAYDKLAIGEHPTISRIVGAIHLDHVPVTTAKREFEKTSQEYEEVEEALKKEFKEIIKQARQKAGEEKVTKDIVDRLEVWEDKIAEVVNSDEFRNYTIKFTGTDVVRTNDKGEEKEVYVEKREAPTYVSEPPAEPESVQSRTPSETHKKKRHVIRIKGKNVEFHHKFAQLGAEANWKNWNNDRGKTIEIFTNTDFPAFEATNDKVFYAVMIIAESIAEVLVKEAEEDVANGNEVKELILRKAAQLEQELDEI